MLINHRERLLAELDSIDDSLDASKRRNHLYRVFVASEHGRLGSRNRVKIPDCVVSYIRSICPSDDGQYTGFHPCVNTRGEDTEVDGDYTMNQEGADL